jgi:septal ring factor EnvC (AmiA/AmiB activator)
LHILTKFLVVVAAILSVLLAGLAVAYTNNADRLVTELRAERTRAQNFEAQIADLTAQAGAERESYQSKISALESRVADLSGRVSRLQSERAQAIARVNELEQNQSLHSAQVDQFTSVAQTYAELNRAQGQELETLREKELEYARREIELSDRINDLAGQLEVSQETNRALQEQLAELRDQLDRMGSGEALAQGNGAGRGYLSPPSNFRSRITAVRDDSAGNVLVQVAAGTSDRLREDMKLMIVRDGAWQANVILERVDQNEAVGRVDFVGRGDVEIAVGDVVLPAGT